MGEKSINEKNPAKRGQRKKNESPVENQDQMTMLRVGIKEKKKNREGS